ncbi:MAG: agmatinase, partial [Proteocatella sp.]
SAMRTESIGIETYSPYQDLDLEDIPVFDAGDLELTFGNAAVTLDTITEFSKEVLEDSKIPFMIGGEHLVTLGSIRAVAEKYPDLHVIHFDAHADLREDYMGEKLSHATVMRRTWEILGDDKIFQFGIRSGERNEFYWGKDHVHTSKFTFFGLEDVIEKLKDKPVYFTLDLDVLDPSIFPGTGTPEAGGVTFNELLGAIMKLAPLNIVGLDINELSPVYDHSGTSTAVACKLVREIIMTITK